MSDIFINATTQVELLKAEVNRLKDVLDHQRKKLRDEFAMAALTGIISNDHAVVEINKYRCGNSFYDHVAAHAYMHADAMLKVREVKDDEAYD